MTKKLKIQMNGRSDQFQTPPEAFRVLKPFLKGFKLVWECAWGKGKLAKQMKKEGFEVIGDKSKDFLKTRLDMESYDIIITNPPYSIKDKFLEHCYSGGRSFALLMPLTALEGKKRGEFYKKHGIQLIIPNKRINFETPSGKGGGAWFQTAWFCWRMNLPKDLNFVELEKNK